MVLTRIGSKQQKTRKFNILNKQNLNKHELEDYMVDEEWI